MNFNHEELTLMMLYNTGTRMGLIHELRLMQCYLMPDETVDRCGVWRVGISPGLTFAACGRHT